MEYGREVILWPFTGCGEMDAVEWLAETREAVGRGPATPALVHPRNKEKLLEKGTPGCHSTNLSKQAFTTNRLGPGKRGEETCAINITGLREKRPEKSSSRFVGINQITKDGRGEDPSMEKSSASRRDERGPGESCPATTWATFFEHF